MRCKKTLIRRLYGCNDVTTFHWWEECIFIPFACSLPVEFAETLLLSLYLFCAVDRYPPFYLFTAAAQLWTFNNRTRFALVGGNPTGNCPSNQKILGLSITRKNVIILQLNSRTQRKRLLRAGEGQQKLHRQSRFQQQFSVSVELLCNTPRSKPLHALLSFRKWVSCFVFEPGLLEIRCYLFMHSLHVRFVVQS